MYRVLLVYLYIQYHFFSTWCHINPWITNPTCTRWFAESQTRRPPFSVRPKPFGKENCPGPWDKPGGQTALQHWQHWRSFKGFYSKLVGNSPGNSPGNTGRNWRQLGLAWVASVWNCIMFMLNHIVMYSCMYNQYLAKTKFIHGV